MVKSEIIKRSPVRVFEETLEGGLGVGNLGVITSRKGVGKTASLIHIATDKLMRDQNVLHISFADDPRHITNWYEHLFDELAKTYKLEDARQVHDDIIRHRLILHYKQQVEFAHLCKDIQDLTKGMNQSPQIMIVDGFPFETASAQDVQNWKSYAQENNTAVWFSATMHREDPKFDDNGIPFPVNQFTDLLSVIIMLNPMQHHIELELLKSHTPGEQKKLQLKLNPRTLLLSNHRA